MNTALENPIARLAGLPGIGDALAKRIDFHFGYKAWDIISRDPYKLAEVRGIGFMVADKIAQERFGIKPDSPARIKAGVDYWFEQRALSGHTAARREDCILGAGELLGSPVSLNGVWWSAGDLVAPHDMRKKEEYIAKRLGDMAARECPAGLCNEVEGLFLDQEAALKAIQLANVFVLTGAPGVGKTATVKAIIAANPIDTLLCAPTGKAAKRLEELTGHTAMTMHRALEPSMVDGKFFFARDENCPLSEKLIIVDESSMIDVWLMYRFMKAVPDDARLILVGDPYQLPSVGPGNVLKDIIESRRVPYAELTQIKRAAPDLLIAQNCARIKSGGMPVTRKDAKDWFVFERSTPQAIADTIVELVTKKLPERYGVDPLKQIQTITALRERSELSAQALNKRLRAQFNPTAFTEYIGVGDRVICTKNDYKLGVFNGDLGMVLDTGKGRIRIAFEMPEREVECRRSEIGLEFAYVLTGHKTQGSEYAFTVIPIHRCLGPMVTTRTWLYTACSRASRATILVGSQSEIANIIGRNQVQLRCTMLRDILEQQIP